MPCYLSFRQKERIKDYAKRLYKACIENPEFRHGFERNAMGHYHRHLLIMIDMFPSRWAYYWNRIRNGIVSRIIPLS